MKLIKKHYMEKLLQTQMVKTMATQQKRMKVYRNKLGNVE